MKRRKEFSKIRVSLFSALYGAGFGIFFMLAVVENSLLYKVMAMACAIMLGIVIYKVNKEN